MKYSIALVSALVTVALGQGEQPKLLNSNYAVQEGEPFTLKFSGCDSGCTIELVNGPKGNLKSVQTLTDSASGDSFDVTLDNVPSDDYAFRITNNDSGLYNFSPQFTYQGTGSLTTTGSASATATTASTDASSSTEATSTEESTASTTMDTTTMSTASSSSSGTATTEASSTTADEATSTSNAPTATTSVPDGRAGNLAPPMALAAGVAAVLAYVN